MANLNRVRVLLTGFRGAPGVSTFYFLDVATALTSLTTLYTALLDFLPSDIRIQVDNAGDVISDVNGDLTGSWGSDAQPMLSGTQAGAYAAPAGILMRWGTSTIRDGSRIGGRTFLVPAASSAFQNDGTVRDDIILTIQAAMLEFIIEQSASFVIWHRPREARAAVPPRRALTAHDGSNALVTSGRVPDKAVVLRSRRD